jgi:hypothetical protein
VTGHFRAGGAFDPAGLSKFQQEGPVTCLVVEGNEARLVYPIKRATPEPSEDLEVLIFLEDNGRPEQGQPADRIGFAEIPDESPDDDPPSEQDSECVLPPSDARAPHAHARELHRPRRLLTDPDGSTASP